MEQQNEAPDNRELYALFNLSPEASYEEIRKAYRQWAQVYHPDKCQSPHMKETATDSFQRVREAYEILSDPKTRLIYDIYGMEGLTSDLESGLEFRPRLDEAAVEMMKTKPALEAELERLMRLMEREKNILREREKIAGHIRSSDTVLANMSLPHYLGGDGLFRGMAMTTEIQAQLSKRNAFTIGVDGHEGAVSAVFGHQISEVSSVEFMASAGLRALNLIGVQTSRKLSSHSAATMGLAMSLKDGSWNLSNLWTRQLSETAGGHVELTLG